MVNREFNLYIDMAIEAHALLRGDADREISGVREDVKQLKNIKITTISILDQKAAQKLNRPIGSYVTIESPPLKINDPYIREEIVLAIEESMHELIAERLKPRDTVLLVGLGNWRATADALGPRFIEYSPITRHYHSYAPEALVEGMRPTCGIAPGVLGITGLETFEVIKGIVEKVKPALLIAVDALAAQDVKRIGTSIQMCNTGIQPGSGVGNARHAINEEELGVPVIAIGCPTIVNAAVIAHEAVKNFCNKTGTPFNENNSLSIIKEILSPFGGSLGVTPKEIDDIIENSTRIISMGVARSLFPGISEEQLLLYAT